MLRMFNFGRMITLCGVVFLMIAVIYLTKDHFFVTLGTQTRLITRQGDPLIYWGYEAGFVLLSIACFAAGSLYKRPASLAYQHSIALPPIAELSGVLKKGCAFLAIAYLVWALLPYSLLGMHRGAQLSPEWASRTIFFAWFLVFGTMFYGLKRRTPIYWKLIPLLFGTYLTVDLAGAVWSLRQLSKPVAPFLVVIVALIVAFAAFLVWWRKQKSFFA